MVQRRITMTRNRTGVSYITHNIYTTVQGIYIDSEDWRNGYQKLIIAIRNNDILKYIKIFKFRNCNNISQYFFFYLFLSNKMHKSHRSKSFEW